MFVQQLDDGAIRLVTSATDLTAASMCEFAFLRRVDVKLGRNVEVPPDDDPMLERAARMGDAHEERTLERYRDEYGSWTRDNPGGVAEIPRPRSMAAGDLTEVAASSLEALHAGSGVVFQATFFETQQRAAAGEDPAIAFLGFADFLRRMPDGAYEVQDTKLARRARVTALLQLAAYAEQLERLEVPVAEEAVLILGDGARSQHKLADIAPVFRARRARLHDILLERVRVRGVDGSRAGASPIAWGTRDIVACGRCEVCTPEIERTRDPLLIAGIRMTQRDRLIAAGYTTIERVASLIDGGTDTGALESSHEASRVEGIADAVLDRLSTQAQLQVGAEGSSVPPVKVVDLSAFAALPAPNEGDLFFDFEGDPLYREPGGEDSARWGLDYLFGMIDTHEHFTAIWAHNLDEERRALEEFIALVAERRRRYPGMRIYHYAAYERTHLTSIAARHGVCEAEVDDLLREHVLVDLYPIVRRALRVGSRSYSIKKLEPLYMGDELRDEDGVTSGAQSVTEYAEASALRESDDAAEQIEAQRRIDAIGDYNRYDCVSTLRLRDWLLRVAVEQGAEPAVGGTRDVDDSESDAAPNFELSSLGAALATHASLAEDARDRRAAALAGSAIDYYQRENKSFWWAHFARLVDPIEEWADTRDVVVVDSVTSEVEHGWQAPEGRQKNYRRRLRLRGTVAPGSSLKPDTEAHLVYEYPPPFEVDPSTAPGARGTRTVNIVERHPDGVTVEETRVPGSAEYSELPIALTPGPPPRAGAQKGAIEEWGSALAAALDSGHFL
ncbi:MAG: TM0106 family RecB-like putative nuclease, partial [Leucobacter sp.]